MSPIIETERLILRELLLSDDKEMFEMDSDPEVHRYLGKKPVKNIEHVRQVISSIRQQYTDNGIGRWAVIEKSSGSFIGWCGFKLMKETTNGHINYFDLGYRFSKKYWGKGYATESVTAWLSYAFRKLRKEAVYAMTETGNTNSRKVLEKTGLTCIETFDYDNEPHYWFKITKAGWLVKQHADR